MDITRHTIDLDGESWDIDIHQPDRVGQPTLFFYGLYFGATAYRLKNSDGQMAVHADSEPEAVTAIQELIVQNGTQPLD